MFQPKKAESGSSSSAKSAHMEDDACTEPKPNCCIICNQPTLLKCASCEKAGITPPFYCGQQHQLQHWKNGHKTACGKNTVPQWKQVQNASVNGGLPYLIAATDLNVGLELFKRTPLLSFPRGLDHTQTSAIVGMFGAMMMQNSITKDQIIACLGCNEFIMYGEMLQDPDRGMLLHKCLKCNWPVHMDVNPGHLSRCQIIHNAECEILSQSKKLHWNELPENLKGFSYFGIALLRVLLLPPADRDLFMKFTTKEFDGGTKSAELLSMFTRDAKQFLSKCPTFFRQGKNLSDEILKQLVYRIFANMLLIPTRPGVRAKYGYVIYKETDDQLQSGRILPHSCLANVALAIDRNTSKGKFKLIRNVKEGETLTLDYLPHRIHFDPIHHRRKVLDEFFTECHCKRCSDPICESAQFWSSIRCPLHDDGGVSYLVPENAAFEKWNCQNTNCQHSEDRQFIDIKLSLVHQRVVEIRGMKDHKAAYAEMKALLDGNYLLHPSNAAMQKGRWYLAQLAEKDLNDLFNYMEGRGSAPKYNLHKKYLEDFEAVMRDLDESAPGLSFRRLIMLLPYCLLKLGQLADNVKCLSTLTLDDADEEMKQIRIWLKQLYDMLKDDLVSEVSGKSQNVLIGLYAKNLIGALEERFGVKQPNLLEKLPNLKEFVKRHIGKGLVDLDLNKFVEHFQKKMLLPRDGSGIHYCGNGT